MEKEALERIADAIERIASMMENNQKVGVRSGGTGNGPPGGGGG